MTDFERKNRIREALAIRGIKQVELAEKTGIPKGTINNWLNNRYQPKQKSLMVLAKALDVSEMWLAGYNVPMERPAEQVKMDELARLIHVIRKDEELKKLCLSIAKLNSDQICVVSNLVNELNKINPQ